MPVRFFNKAKLKILTGVSGIKLDGDLRLLLCMTNHNCLTALDSAVEFLSNLTLDECDGSGYARLALSGSTPVVSEDAARDSIKIVCASHPVFPTLGPGTRNIGGVLLYWNVLADDAQSVPFLFFPYTTPRVPDGGNFTVELPSDKKIFEAFSVAEGTSPVLA